MSFFNNVGASISTELLKLLTPVHPYVYHAAAWTYRAISIHKFNTNCFYIEAQVEHNDKLIGHYTTFVMKYNDVIEELREVMGGAIDFSKIHAMNLDFIGTFDRPSVRIRVTVIQSIGYDEKVLVLLPYKILNKFNLMNADALKRITERQGYKFIYE